eukprot:CAMPEP_0202967064 /NCGR_PEP_ID=MMETSP1396-20130829/11793_1 /ASSEMBLY_ACC=CAM_ASM_000872 /TAXON_ID= /ORGANISM="Pseudokeronopsis sp., Strain Brazil" /LENGTH=100 /DNA_ID=CAMNT_0049691697 /DNA_START=1260 /DNA_END=1563 /DNA_ORIENTATION=+
MGSSGGKEERSSGGKAEDYQSGWIEHEMRKLIRQGVKLMRGEVHRYDTIWQMVKGVQKDYSIEVDDFFMRYVEQGVAVKDESGKFPLLNKVVEQVLVKAE